MTEEQEQAMKLAQGWMQRVEEEPTEEVRMQAAEALKGLGELLAEVAQEFLARLRPLLEWMGKIAKDFLWRLRRALNPPPLRWPPLRDKRSWQKAQRQRARVRRSRRAAAKVRTALFYRQRRRLA